MCAAAGAAAQGGAAERSPPVQVTARGSAPGRERGSVTLQAPNGEAAFATQQVSVGHGPGQRGLLCPEVWLERSGGPRSVQPRTAPEVTAKPPEDRPGPRSDLPHLKNPNPRAPGGSF